jgi:kynureninase
MTKFSNIDIGFAHKLDSEDELASFRDEFVIDDPNLIYLDGNSLGRLPKRSIDFMKNAIEEEWGKRLIRVWNDGWVNTPTELGAKIAKLVGAKADEILVTEATSINLFKLAVAALQARPNRAEIISDELNFPSDLYILQGIIELLGKNHQLKLISSAIPSPKKA